MRLSRIPIIFIVFIFLLSVLVAKISFILSINVDDLAPNDGSLQSSSSNDEDYREENSSPLLQIGDSPNNLMWFLQISDIHISIFHDMTRVSEFKEFCDLTVSAIQPTVVVASGDLTDAKSENNMGSRQYVDEWKYYRKILQECRATEKTVWLDVRGNHDNFNVPDIESSENYYRNYSVQGRLHPRSYLAKVAGRSQGELYSFVAVDACLDPGPRRPFNFVGVLSKHEYAMLKHLGKEAKNGTVASIWFGHYPTSCILAPSPGARALVGQGLAYLCGHFHTFGGLVPNMYTMQHAGNLELELGDWKDNRMYRLAAVDHGLFSFIDVGHHEWPVILVTNPKHSLYVMPSKEPVARISSSTHIRVLAFSISPISSVKVSIDESPYENCSLVEGPLYVLKWDPKKYSSGLHQITVFVRDGMGREKFETVPFSLDGTRLSFRLLPRIALMCDISKLFQIMFGTMLCVCVVPLSVIKIIHKLVKDKKIKKPRIPVRIFNMWLRKLWILSTVDRLYYPLTLYALYLTIGPWSIGEVIEGHTGVIFAWGTVIRGSYLPGSFTYAYGFLQMVSFQLPLTLFLAHCVDRRYFGYDCKRSCLRYFCFHLPFFVIVTVQLIFASFFWLAYGTMAFLLGPLRTWSIVLGIILWQVAIRLPERYLRGVSSVWPRHSDSVRESMEGEEVSMDVLDK
ncbi:transmembrane protein 62-like [Ischnura elegans]|uniref:transmembrane protein 62-like n=1 Tax=Ischnura elegans TaxID=197161 RepID=UPI001ED8ADF3|nr:transmembrane protein 62-like [Ischnura elegans]